MQIDKDKGNRLVAWVLAGICILPYLETGVVRTLLSYKSATVYWRSITSFLLIGFFLCMMPRKKISNIFVSKKTIICIFFFAFIFIRSLLVVNSVSLAIFNQIVMFVVPIVFSEMCIRAWKKINAPNSYIIKRMIFIYTLFVIITIYLNIRRYGMSISGITQFRLTASGGGSVPYGFSIAIIYTLFVKYRHMFSKLQSTAISAVFLVASALNQSRVGLVICLFLSFYQFLFQKKAQTRIIGWITFFAISISLFSNLPLLIETYFPRLLSAKSSRTDTWINCLNILVEHPEKLLYGYGVDGFFKYQNWQATVDVSSIYSDANYGTFVFENMRFLIQPHNSFLYVLIEYGIGGLVFLISEIHSICKNRILCLEDLFVPIVFVVINFFDSILLVEPGSAFLWWYLLRISAIGNEESGGKI